MADETVVEDGSPERSPLGEYIREMGVTAVDLAKLLGYTVQGLGLVLRGRVGVSARLLLSLEGLVPAAVLSAHEAWCDQAEKARLGEARARLEAGVRVGEGDEG